MSFKLTSGRQKSATALVIGFAVAMAAASQADAKITTFATSSAIGGANFYFNNPGNNGAHNNNKSSSATIYTISHPTDKVAGSITEKFSFINLGGIGNIIDDVKSTFTFNATLTNTPASAVAGFAIQPNINGSFSYLSQNDITVGNKLYKAGSNLLTGTFTGGGIAGGDQGTSGFLGANTQSGTITYTSDFLDFSNVAKKDASFALTAIVPDLTSLTFGTYALKTFSADSGGQFSTDPAPTVNSVPEPATWGLMLIGVGGIGAVMRQRRTLVAA